MTINELIKKLEELQAKYGEDTACTGEVIVSPKNRKLVLDNGAEIDWTIPSKHVIMH